MCRVHPLWNRKLRCTKPFAQGLPVREVQSCLRDCEWSKSNSEHVGFLRPTVPLAYPSRTFPQTNRELWHV